MLINAQRDFPGAWSLLPTMGALALIAAGRHPGWHQRLPRQPALVPAQMQDWLQAYAAVFERLHRSGRHVVFVLDNPTLPGPNDCICGRMSSWPLLGDLLYRRPKPSSTQRYSDHLCWTAPYHEFARRLQAENPQVMVYNPAPLLCDSAADLCPMARQGQFLHSYGEHLSDVANSLIARDLLPRIRERWSLP